MNEELTNEVLEAMTKCKENCFSCGANEVCSKYCWQDTMRSLAAALLEERTKPKVWEFAPITADRAVVYYYVGNTFFGEKTYTRELPKTRARQIAENTYVDMEDFTHEDFIDAIESALIKYAEELEGNHERRTDKRSTGSDEEV
jgi:hypothetical protein